MLSVKSVGLLGGSFNPVHNGHIALAKEILVEACLDEVWFVVSPQNPLKPTETLLDDELRFEMTRLALEGEPHLVASDYEFRLPRPSYTWNTLRHLFVDYPQYRFVLLIGADNWHVFGNWRNGKEILSACQVIIYPRRGYVVDEYSLPDGVRVINTSLHDVSSTMVRKEIAEGKDVSRHVPTRVLTFIKQKHLYK
ncbi:nicotinate (nicotinamide) nucleotide adenylyltransferase [Prevotella sp. OH937_COT-195]|uniref:nicotinate (nicotinamide) nucleotide adenylyltransferase n=1 Tax=Prevotella sp. OH937_COT-195 TaxID=2491051 RepID=UPI000F648565|nr:nicotinate (nicotinamide) nucleotide adenylyltransferase [Prevotella sp. OH937_COT-195]RRD02537.1 nicotinate-nucleotide adenylyltransferase [Prevotella sp. OH937_COT-195]